MDIPLDQDEYVAQTKIEMLKMTLDELTPEQHAYIKDYNAGT